MAFHVTCHVYQDTRALSDMPRHAFGEQFGIAGYLNGEKVIVAKPNHSSTWRHNLWLLAALAIPSLGAVWALPSLAPGPSSPSQALSWRHWAVPFIG